MRVCYFYTKKWDKAVAALPSDAELIYVGGSLTAYWEAVSERWGGDDDLMFVEHDNVIHENVVREFEDCENQWCTFPYWHDCWLERGLGCTRFRKELMAQITPGQIQTETYGSCNDCNDPLALVRDSGKWRVTKLGHEIFGCWRHIDAKISHSLIDERGIWHCIHTPPVEHLTYPVPEGVTFTRNPDDLSKWYEH